MKSGTFTRLGIVAGAALLAGCVAESNPAAVDQTATIHAAPPPVAATPLPPLAAVRSPGPIVVPARSASAVGTPTPLVTPPAPMPPVAPVRVFIPVPVAVPLFVYGPLPPCHICTSEHVVVPLD